MKRFLYLNTAMRLIVSILFLTTITACFEKTSSQQNDSALENAVAESKRGEFFIGGQIIGLHGSIVLSYNGKTQTIDKNGSFRLENPLQVNTEYAIAITQEPESQTCFLQNGNGKVARADLNTVVVVCFEGIEISGTVNGISAPVTIKTANNQTAIVKTTGTFRVKVKKVAGNVLPLMIESKAQNCDLANAGDLLGVQITCTEKSDPLQFTAQPWSEQVRLTWNDVDASYYNIYYSTSTSLTAENYRGDIVVTKKTTNTSPLLLESLDANASYSFLVEAVYSNFSPRIATVKAIPYSAIGFNGEPRVLKAATSGNLYLGGDFSMVGFKVQNLAFGGTDSTTSTVQLPRRLPYVDSTITTSVPDGKGGWFIGGWFTRIGQTNINRLAHILADGSLDPNWSYDFNNTVHALVFSNGNLYVGGNFTSTTTQNKSYFVVIDAQGNIRDEFPQPNAAVNAIHIASGLNYSIFIGGAFTTVGQTARRGVAAMNSSGTLNPNWNPNSGGPLPVSALAVANNRVFVGGGLFNSQNYFAAYNATDGASQVTITAGSPDSPITSFAVKNSELIIGGNFNSIGGVSRPHLASIDINSTNLTDWNPVLSLDKSAPVGRADFGSVLSTYVNGNRLYVSGLFRYVNGQRRDSVAAFDLSLPQKTLHDWDLVLGSNYYGPPNVNTISISNQEVLVGGDIYYAGGVRRDRLAALDSNGYLTEWNPGLDSDIQSIDRIVTHKQTVFVTGDFRSMRGSPRSNIAGFSESGQLLNFSIPDTDYVEALALTDDAVYYSLEIPGEVTDHRFRKANYAGQTIWGDKDTHILFGGTLYDILVFNEHVVVAGNQFYIQQYRRYTNLGIFDTDGNDRQFTAFEPDAITWRLRTDGTRLYVLGDFANLGNTPRSNFGALEFNSQTMSFTVSDWIPSITNGFNHFGFHQGIMYIGGDFSTNNRTGLAAVNTSTGTLVAWAPRIGDNEWSISDLAATNSAVFITGFFTSLNEQPGKNLFALDFDGNLKSIPFLSPPWANVQNNTQD